MDGSRHNYGLSAVFGHQYNLGYFCVYAFAIFTADNFVSCHDLFCGLRHEILDGIFSNFVSMRIF